MNHRALHLSFILAIFSSGILCSCVSVNLPSREVVPSTKLSFTAPAKPFVEKDIQEIQHSWISSDTSNIISVQSNCSQSSDPALEAMATDAFAAMDKYDIQDSKEIMFNDRKAIRSEVKGEVDGVSVKMDVLVTKKDGCRYTLSYSGKTSGFAKEQRQFDSFVQGFKIQ